MSTPTPASGYVLAGGRSVRMGCDKAELLWRGRTLLDHMIHLLSHICRDIFVVGRGSLPDIQPGLGPIGGVSTALHHSSTESNVIVAVDLPLLTPAFLKYFKERCDLSPHPLTVCNIESEFPLCIGIRRALREKVDAYIKSGNRSLHGFIAVTPAEIITEGFEPQIFANINTFPEYRSALDADKP